MMDCWYWLGSKCYTKGLWYGTYWDNRIKKSLRAHRLSYESYRGPIAIGMEIDHLCRNTLCINTRHLQAVSHTVNVLRGISPGALNAKKTHGPCGHAYTSNDGLRRYCQPCRNKWHREYYHRNKVKLLERQKHYPKKPLTDEQKEKHRIYSKQYYADNRERLKARALDAWRKSCGK